MSKWRSASAIEALRKTADFVHIRRVNPRDPTSKELFGTIARVPFSLESGEPAWAVGLSTRRTNRMPSRDIGRQASLGRATRAAAEELGIVGRTTPLDETGAYSIMRGVMTLSQMELFLHLCEQSPDNAITNFATALQAPSLLEAA